VGVLWGYYAQAIRLVPVFRCPARIFVGAPAASDSARLHPVGGWAPVSFLHLPPAKSSPATECFHRINGFG
jgi:hypothetical protein